MGAPRPAPCATPWGQWHRTPPGPDWRRGGRRSPMPTRVWERETQVVVAGLGVRGQRVLLRPVAPAGPRWDQRRPGRWTQSGPGRPSCPSGWICATGARSRRQPGRSSSECGSVRWARGHPAPRLHLADARPGSGPALPHVQARPRPAPSTWASSEPLSLPGETSRAPPPVARAQALPHRRAHSALVTTAHVTAVLGPQQAGPGALPGVSGKPPPAPQTRGASPRGPGGRRLLTSLHKACGRARVGGTCPLAAPTRPGVALTARPCCRAESQHRFWKPSEVDEEVASAEVSEGLRSRRITFAGRCEPVRHRCRAPKPNGQLCERQDRLKVRGPGAAGLASLGGQLPWPVGQDPSPEGGLGSRPRGGGGTTLGVLVLAARPFGYRAVPAPAPLGAPQAGPSRVHSPPPPPPHPARSVLGAGRRGRSLWPDGLRHQRPLPADSVRATPQGPSSTGAARGGGDAGNDSRSASPQCPFHGTIVPRDDAGRPLRPEDRAREQRQQRQRQAQRPGRPGAGAGGPQGAPRSVWVPAAAAGSPGGRVAGGSLGCP